MRYSAVTCDPDDFTREAGWTLRAENYGRDTRLLVAIVSRLLLCLYLQFSMNLLKKLSPSETDLLQ